MRPRAANGLWIVLLTGALLIVAALLFVAAFVFSSGQLDRPTTAFSEGAYETEVAEALNGASAAVGEQLIEQHNCVVCHVRGDGRVAPKFAGIANRAARRRPPLTAPQYLYESIVAPAAFLVDGYAQAMPNNYATRLTPSEIGHIIAHLLTWTNDADS